MGLAWRGPAVGLSLCPWELGDGHVSHRSLRAKRVPRVPGSQTQPDCKRGLPLSRCWARMPVSKG